MNAEVFAGLGNVTGALASGIATGGAASILDTLASLFKLGATPGGQAALERLLPSKASVQAEQDALDAAIARERHVMPPEV